MTAPNIVRQVAGIANGKTCRIVGPHGEFTLSAEGGLIPVQDAVIQKAMDQMQSRLSEIEQRITASLATANAMSVHLGELASRVEMAIAAFHSAASEDQAVASKLKSMEDWLKLPVVPVFDKAGKVIAAERKRVVKK